MVFFITKHVVVVCMGEFVRGAGDGRVWERVVCGPCAGGDVEQVVSHSESWRD